jgi:hypothetical protein
MDKNKSIIERKVPAFKAPVCIGMVTRRLPRFICKWLPFAVSYKSQDVPAPLLLHEVLPQDV